jgi:hypothetical protein
MKRNVLFLFCLAIVMASCDDDEVNAVPPKEAETTSFKITISNTINYLSAKSFGEGPLTATGQTHTITFQATRGTYLSFANMFAQSNDWFFATDDAGIPLWNGDTPKTGDISNYIKLYDAGSEEDEDFLTDFSNTVYTAPKQSSPNLGPEDDDNTVRDTGRSISNYLTSNLDYDTATKTFTLTITKADRESLHNPGFITPGILVVHTQPHALFEEGLPLRDNGLESIVEDGSPLAIYDWFNAEGSNGAPLRLSASHTPFAPGLAYTFTGKDPLFTQGEAAVVNSGLEEMAEDGNSALAIQYLNDLGINVVASSETTPVGPGETMTFYIDAMPGDKFGFATMFVQSNDWFLSFNNDGVALFDTDGSPKNGAEDSIQSYLFDAGTEADETVGFGDYQAPRQTEANSGTEDTNTQIRRVTEIEDVQFGKDIIRSTPGVVSLEDARGGYNLITVTIEPMN